MRSFEETFNALNKIDLKSHTAVFGYPKTEEKYFIAGRESRQTEVDELQKMVDELEFQLADWKQKSLLAMINGMCSCCGKEPLQGVVSDKEGYALLHCFGCGANKYKLVGEQALKGGGE